MGESPKSTIRKYRMGVSRRNIAAIETRYEAQLFEIAKFSYFVVLLKRDNIGCYFAMPTIYNT